MTNYEKIISMSIDKLAKLLADTFTLCRVFEAHIDGNCDNRCVKAQKNGLKVRQKNETTRN